MSTLSKLLYGGLSGAVLLGFSMSSFAAGSCGTGYAQTASPGQIICKSTTGGADKPIKTCQQCKAPVALQDRNCLGGAVSGEYTGDFATNCGLKWPLLRGE
ncbi:MAG: hypothetical protein H0U70_02800 [Tatlockia sp.]|nr:hypothetical protein [Tatlockia sp.]